MKYRIIMLMLMLITLTWMWTLVEFVKSIFTNHEIIAYSWQLLLVVMSGGILYFFIVFPPEKDANTT